jgi:hypothetical protein
MLLILVPLVPERRIFCHPTSVAEPTTASGNWLESNTGNCLSGPFPKLIHRNKQNDFGSTEHDTISKTDCPSEEAQRSCNIFAIFKVPGVAISLPFLR